MRRFLTGASFVTGLALLVVALLAPAASGRAEQSRVLRLNVSDTEVSYLDPALSYDFIGWRIELATCARLLWYPDASGAAANRLQPEVATGFPRITNGGKTYTFTVREGYRFADGSPVTAESFAHAITRALSPKLQSPAASFLQDVVGADKVLAGKATKPSGVTVSGNTLTIRTTQVAPDFLARIAMPFFCAIPPDLPLKVTNVIPGSGPYTTASFVPGRQVVLKQNPYYTGGRKRNWDEMRITLKVNSNASYLQVRKGEADYDMAGLPPTAHAQLARDFGVNKSRYFVHPLLAISYVALNTSRPFFGDAATRQAVSYAVDRRAITRVAGLYAGTPDDQLLPPGIPGRREAVVYPNTPNVAKAKELLNGKTGSVVLYTGNDPTSVNTAQILQVNLKKVGIDVKVKQFTFAVQIDKTGRRGEPFDMNLIGWFADYPDPYDFINILLYGKTIQKTGNVNTAYFDDPKYNKLMEQAARLRGDARYRAYGALDLDITRNAAPFIVTSNSNVREFVSARIGCPTYAANWGGLNLVTLCLKK
jgi:ABC-type transport system substrate-binding protein